MRIEAKFQGSAGFAQAFAAQIEKGGLFIAGDHPVATDLGSCTVAIFAGSQSIEIDAQLAAATPGVGVAVLISADVVEKLRTWMADLAMPPTASEIPPSAPDESIPLESIPLDTTPSEGSSNESTLENSSNESSEIESIALEGIPLETAPVTPTVLESAEATAEETGSPDSAAPTTPKTASEPSQTEKIQLALNGNRNERMAILRDSNRMLHIYILKNPRIGLDEIEFAAKSPTFSPDGIKMIADHPDWGRSPSICIALLRNPKTPLAIALRLIDRVPLAEVRAIAKAGNARAQIVTLARKKVSGTG